MFWATALNFPTDDWKQDTWLPCTASSLPSLVSETGHYSLITLETKFGTSLMKELP